MKWFLTGGTGFLGNRLANQLLDQGHEVVALVRDPSRAQKLEQNGAELVEGDILEKDTMRGAMSGVDGVYHLAARVEIPERNPELSRRINVVGTRNVLELMREREVPRGVFTSSLAVFSDTQGHLVDETYRFNGSHLGVYDRTKWEAHYEVAVPMMEQGLPLTVVQPGLVYGPGDDSSLHDIWVQFLKGKLPMIPGRTALCWGHVEDTVRAHRLAMNRGKPGESYIIAGPPHTAVEAMEMAEDITGIKRPMAMPPQFMRILSVLMRPVSHLVNLPDDFHPERLRVTAGTTYIASNEKARNELGFEPRALEQGLRETLTWEQRQLSRNTGEGT